MRPLDCLAFKILDFQAVEPFGVLFAVMEIVLHLEVFLGLLLLPLRRLHPTHCFAKFIETRSDAGACQNMAKPGYA